MPENLPKDKKLVSIRQAAEILEVSLDTIRRWDKAGKIHSSRPDGKTRYFSLDEIEKLKFTESMSIGDACKMLGISASTLRRIEKKGLIAPERTEGGERRYSRSTLEKFLNSEYFLRKDTVQAQILEPLKAPVEPAPVSLDIPILPTHTTAPAATSGHQETVHKVLGARVEDLARNMRKVLLFRKAFFFSGAFIGVTVCLLIFIVTILFFIAPQATGEYFGYYNPAYEAEKISQVLGVSTDEQPEAEPSVSALSQVLSPITRVSLAIVKTISEPTYDEAVTEPRVRDVAELFTLNEQGQIVPLKDMVIGTDAVLVAQDTTLIPNLNAEFVGGRAPGTGPGNIVILDDEGNLIIEGVIKSESVGTAALLDGAVTSAKIADGTITEDDIEDGAISADKLASGLDFALEDNEVTSAKIGAGEVSESDINDGAVTSSKISNNTITGSDLAGTITFSDGDYLDLSAIIHDDTALQGLRLPNVASGVPSSPSAGEGYIAWDTAGNQLLVYDGATWVATAGDITDVTAGNGLSGGASTGGATLALNLTTSGTTGATASNSGLEVGAGGLTLLKGCADNEILKWTDGGGWACATDAGASGAAITVEEGDATVDATVTNLDFLAGDFEITESPEDEVNITLAATLTTVTGVSGDFTVGGGDLVGSASALTLDTSGAGTISLGSNATTVGICNSATCDTINIGTNADTDTITIGDSTDDLSLADAQWSITGAGAASFVSLTVGGDTITEFVGTGLTNSGGTISTTLGTSIAGSEIDADTIDLDRIADGLSLDADLTFAAGAGEDLTVNKTYTDATSETGVTFNFTASDTSSGTTAQYGLYLDNIASTEGLDAAVVIDNSDTDDAVGAALRIIDGGGGFTTLIDNNGTLISGTELNRLDGKDAALIDTNDAVATAITGTGALDAGSITSNFGAINVGTDAITTSGTITAGTLSVNSENFTDLTGNGVTISSNALTINLTSSGTTGATASNSGLEVGTGGLTLLKGCADNEILKWTDGGGWACASDATGSASNTFETFDAPSGTDPVADSSTDTFTFAVSGTNITITGDSSADSVTFNIDESVLAGAGLAANGSALDVGAGNGISVAADAISVNEAYGFTFTGATTFSPSSTNDLDINLDVDSLLTIDQAFSSTTSANSTTITATNASTSGTQNVLYVDNAASTGATESLLVLDNSDTDTAVSAAIQIVDGGGGFTTLIDNNGTLISGAELNRLDGKDAALIDTNDAVATAITGTGTLTAGATGAGFTLNFGTSTLSGNIGTANISGIDISDDTNLTATNGITFTGDELSLASSTGGAGLTYTTGVLAVGAGTGISVAADSISATLGTDITNSELVDDTVDFDKIIDSASLDTDFAVAAGAGEDVTLNKTYTNNTGENAFVLNLTASDTGSGTTTQYGLYIDNLASTEAADASLVIDNSDTDDAVGAAIRIVDAGGGFTTIIDNAGTLISGAELNRLDGKDAALVDTNDAVTTAITGTGTLTAGATGAGFTINFGTSTLSGNIGTSNVSGLDVSDDTNLTATNGITLTGDQLTLDSATGGAGLTYTTGVLAVGAGTGISVAADSISATLGTDITNSELVNDTIDFDKVSDTATLDADTSITAAAGRELTYAKTFTDATSENGLVFNFTASDSSSGTTAQYGLYVDNLASTEGLDAGVVIDNSDADDAVGAAIRIVDAGGGFTTIIDNAGTLISGAELNRLDGKDAALIDTNDAVATAITGTGTLTAGATGAGFTINFGTSTLSGSIGTANISGLDISDDTNLTATNGITLTGDQLTLDSATGGAGLTYTTGVLAVGAGTGISVAADSISATLGTDITNAELVDDTVDFDKITDSSSLDTDWAIAAGAGEDVTVNKTFTNNTGENAFVLNLTASDTGSGTTTQYGLYIDNLASTEAADASLVLDNSDTDDAVGAAIRIVDAGGGFTNIIDNNGTLISGSELNILDSGIALSELSDSGTLTAGTVDINGGNIDGTVLGASSPAAGTFTGVTITTSALAVNSDSITSDGATLVVNAGGTVDVQDGLTVDSLTSDTGGVSIAAGQSYTGAGAVTLSSGGSAALTLDSASGTVGLASNDDLSATGDVTFTLGGTETVTFTLDPAADTAGSIATFTIDGEDTIGSDEAQIGLALVQSSNGTDVTEGADALLTLTNNDANDAVNVGIRFDAGAGGTDFATGIDFDAADVTTEIVLENGESIANQTDNQINLTIGSNGTLLLTSSTAATISNSAGSLILDSNGGTIDINDGTIDVATQATDVEVADASATALTISQGANAYITIDTTDGAENLVLSSGTSGTTRFVRIGATSSSTTPDLLVLDSKSDAGNPTGTSGALFMNSSNKLMINENGTWKELCNKTDAACGAGSGSSWSALTDPTGNLALSMAEYTTAGTWDTAATAATLDALTYSITNDAGTDANVQRLMVLQNNNDGAATGSTEALLVLNNADANEAVADALVITSSGAGGITTGIDFDDTDIVTDIEFQNGETLSNDTDDMLVFTGAGGGDNTDLQIDLDGTHPVVSSPTDSTIEIAEGLTVSGASLTATSATTVTLGSSGADTITIGNAGADTIAIGGAASTGVSLTDDNWSITTAGAGSLASLTINSELVNDFSGSGIAVTSNALTVNLTTSGTTGSTSSNSGLEVGAGGLTLLKGCADNEILKWTDGGGWACASDSTGGTANIFLNIDTPSGSDPAADSSTDTLALAVTGTNLTITGDSGADSVTFDIVESTLAGAGLVANGSAIDVGTGTGISVAADAISVNQDTAFAWTNSQTYTFVGTENLAFTSDLAGSVNVLSITGTPSSTTGTTAGLSISQASSANSNGLDAGLYIDNADADLAIPAAIQIANSGGGGYTTIINNAGTLISGTELNILDGGIALSELTDSGTLTAGTVDINGGNIDGVTIGGASAGAGTFTQATITTGALAVNSDSITSDGATLTINAAGAVDIQDGLTADTLTVDAGNLSVSAGSIDGALALSGSTSDNSLQITLTNGTSSGTQNAAYIDNAASSGTTEALLVLDNSDTNTAVTAAIQIVDAGGGFTTIIDNAGTLISGAELNRLDGKDAALIDTNDAVATAITGTGTLTAGATGAGFTLNFGTSTLSGSIGTSNVSGLDISDDTNLTATNGITLTGDQLTLDSATGGAGLTYTTGVLAVGAGTGISVAADSISATLGTDITNSELVDDTVDFDKIIDSASLDTDFAVAAGAGEDVTLNKTYTNNTGENAFVLNLTASDTGSGTTTQYGLYVDNLASTEAVDASLVLDNSDTDDAVGAAIRIVDAGGGFTTIIDNAGTLISGAELNRLDGKDAALIDTNDAVATAITGTGTLTAGATGAGFTIDLSTSTVTGSITGAIISGIDISDDTNLTATNGITLTGDQLTLDSATGGAGLTYTTGVLAVGAGTGISVAADSISATLGTDITNSELVDDTVDFDKITDSSSLDTDWAIAAGTGEDVTLNKTFTDATSESGLILNFTASDSSSGTTAQYGLYVDNIASTEGLDAAVVIDNSDTDDTVGAAIRIVDAGGGFTTIIDNAGTLISGAELNRLDGKDAALIDTNDAVATAITGTGALDAGSITSNFGAINVGADNITTTGSVLGNSIDRSTAGALTFGDTTATSVSFCNSTACDTITIGTNTDADTITIGEANDDVSLTDAQWSITGAGAASFASVTSTGAIAANSASGITSTQSTLVINAGGSVDVQDGLTVDSATVDNGNLAVSTGTIDGALTLSGSSSDNLLQITLTNSSTSGTQNVAYFDNAASTGATESLVVIDNSDTDTAVTNAIEFVNAGGGFTNLFNVAGTAISSTEFTILDGGIAMSELTDSGTLTVGTVDINGGAIDGVTIGGASAGAGTFSSLTSNGDLTVSGGDITGAASESIDIGEAADATFTFLRNDAGTVTLTANDNDTTAALLVTPGGSAQLTLGDSATGSNGDTVAIFSSDWEIDTTGAITGISLDANGAGNAITNIESADIADSTLAPGDFNTQGTDTDEYCLTRESTSGAPFEWQACGGGTITWSSIGDATGDDTISFGSTAQVMEWQTMDNNAGYFAFNFTNAGTSAGNDYGVVINNRSNTSASTDNATEALLLMQQQDTSVGSSVNVDNFIYIDVAANAGATDGIEITNSGGNLTNALNIADTGGGVISTAIAFSGTFTTLFDVAGTALTASEVTILDSGIALSELSDSGTLTAGTVDINGGNIDGVTIGGASAGAGTFSSLTSNGDLIVSGGDVTGSSGDSLDIGEVANSQFTFTINSDSTVVITSADSTDANTPLTVQSAGTGGLLLDTAGAGTITVGSAATTVDLCNSAACDTLNLGTNTDADTITIGEVNDNVAITDAQWSVTGAGAGTFASLSVGETISDFSGDGLIVSAGSLAVRLDTTAADGASTTSVSGLEFVSGELSLIRGCSAGQVLKWDNTNFEWDCGDDNNSGGATAWDGIADPAASGAIAFAATAQTMDWDTAGGTGALDGMTITFQNDITTDASVQRALVIQNANDGGSNGVLDVLLALNNADTNEAVTDAINISSSGGGAITTAIDIDDTDVVTDIELQNGETIDNNTDGVVSVGSLTNRANIAVYGDLVKEGLIDNTTMANVNDIFVYDTTRDSDGGAWTNSTMTQNLSWYSESKNDGPGDPCVVGTDTRCGKSEFPKKAIIVSTNSAVHIFDALDNSLWMSFTQAGTYALGADASNNPSGVFALNGVIYVGTNGTGTGLYAFDFISDKLFNYDAADRTQGDKNIANRNTAVSYATNSIAALAITATVNDVHGAVISGSSITQTNGGPLNGNTFIAVATDDGARVMNMSSGKVLIYADGATTDDVNQVWVTKRGRLYLTNETFTQIERYNDIETSVANDNGPDDIWDEATGNLPNAFKTAPTLSTSPDALEVIERETYAESTADTAKADVIYVGHSQGLTEIHDVNAPSGTVIGWSKFYNSSFNTGYMSGTPRGFFPFNETTGDLVDATIRNNVLEPENPPTYGVDGVRGTGLSFNGTDDFLCADTTNDGTCDNDTDFDTAAISFHVELWFRHPTSISGTDMLVSKKHPTLGGAEGIGYQIYMNSSGQIVFGIQDTAATAGFDDSVTSTLTYHDNEWHHLVAVNTDTAICLYLDGRLAVACDTTLGATGSLSGNILTVGADGSAAAGGNFWTGEIDDLYFAGGGGTTSDSLTQAQARRKYMEGRQALSRKSLAGSTATSGTSNTIVNSGLTMTANDYAGGIVEITSGTGSGQTRRVISNTATTLTVSPDWTVTPSTDSVFEIQPEQLYGASNVVDAISVTDTDFLGRTRRLYVGTNQGSDGGGVTVFQGYGNGYASNVYHSGAGMSDDAGTAWSGTDFDDIKAIDAKANVVAFGSVANTWVERADQNLEQSYDLVANNINQIRAELLVDGLLGTSPESGVLGAGADLAEYYTSDMTLTPGALVSLHSNNVGGVVLGNAANRKNLIGVVATEPGLVLGSKFENSYPIALAGRVPVKVTNQNGLVMAGDSITASALDGYGMRALTASRVVGIALNDMDEASLVPCSEGSDILCGEVTMFVNPVDYSGTSIEKLILSGGVTIETPENKMIQLFGESGAQIQQYFNQYAAAEMQDSDGINTTSVTALSMNVDTLYANTIKADRIEGLEIYTDRIDSLTKLYEQMQATGDAATQSTESLEDMTAKTYVTLSVLSQLEANGSLQVLGASTFNGIASFNDLVTFAKGVIFKDKVEFEKYPVFSSNTAGYAVVQTGERIADVVFETPYSEAPVVTTSIVAQDAKAQIDVMNALGTTFMLPKQDYVIANVTKDGFTIILEEPAVTDLTFSWVAISVKEVKTTVSPKQGATPVPTPAPAPTDAPVVEPTLTPTPEPVTEVTVVSPEVGYVRMREEASAESTELAQITDGTVLVVLEASEGWYKVDYDGAVGWVSAEYVSAN